MSFNFSLQSVKSSDFWLLPKPADVVTIDAVEATYSFESEITISFEKKEVSVVLATLVKPTEEYPSDLLGITVKVIFNLHEMEKHIDKVLQSIPDELLNSLINVTLGSTRGILLERCRDTYFENTFLPLINPAEIPRKSNESMIMDRIVKLINEKKYAAVNLVIDKAIIVYPNIAEFYFAKGWVLQNIEENDEKAMVYYEKSILLNPNYSEAHNNIGIIYGSLNEHEKAVEYYKKAIFLNPNNANFYFNTGLAYIELKQYEKAIEYFEKVISLNSNYSEAYYNIGSAYFDLNNHEKALENYKKALKINPQNAGTLFNLSCLQRLTKDKKTALSYLEKSINLDIKYKAEAKTDTDLEWLWDDADFKKMTK
jgi:tetratricopeptide (TPR) repeat protein